MTLQTTAAAIEIGLWIMAVVLFIALVIAFHREWPTWVRVGLIVAGAACLVMILAGEPLILLIIPAYGLLTFVSYRAGPTRLWWLWVVVVIGLLVASKLSFGGGTQAATFDVDRGIWLGFSYLAFRLVHLTYESHNGKIGDAILPELLIYTLHPASLIAGPIDRVKNSVKAQRETGDIREDLHHGLWRVLVGLFTRFVIAGAAFSLINFYDMTANPNRPVGIAWLWLVTYSIYLLADFAGYSHIAIGIGRMMGMRLPENFNRPYESPSITVFWQRWHISLSFWLRDYVFFPVARGLRQRYPDDKYKTLIQFISHMATMISVGLWHGLTGGFLLWGIWHGLGMFLVSQFYTYKPVKKDKRHFVDHVRYVASIVGTYLFVTLGWVWFTADVPTAIRIYARLFGLG